MAERKTPILLRPGGLTGGCWALYRYSRKTIRGREVIECGSGGKQDVTADFDRMLLHELMPDAGCSIVAELDGAAQGMELDDDERKVIREFRERLITIIERHNACLDSSPSGRTEESP